LPLVMVSSLALGGDFIVTRTMTIPG